MARINPYGLKIDLDAENEAVIVTLRKREGEGFVEVESETFPLADTHPDLQVMERLYGKSKILQDRCSQVDAGPGKLPAMREVAALLNRGEWEKERTAGAPTVSAEIEALAELRGVSVAVVQKAIRNYTAEQRAKILAHPSVVAKAAEIVAARAEQGTEMSFDNLL